MEIRKDYVTPNPMFWAMLSSLRKAPQSELKEHYTTRNIIALDPGETTGFAHWDGARFELMQFETKDVGEAYGLLDDIVTLYKPDHIRAEEYRVYGWMADQHSWSVLHTPQLIGAIKALAYQKGIPLSFKLAQHAKALWNDDNLKRSALYSPGQKHARDALRHACLYMSHPDLQD